MKTLFIAVMTTLFLTACAPDPENVPRIAGSQRDALEKAKSVDATVKQNAEEQQQQVEQQTK
jgi:outer membrane lipoprotein-sorting protein